MNFKSYEAIQFKKRKKKKSEILGTSTIFFFPLNWDVLVFNLY